MFSFEYSEVFNNIFFYRTTLVVASAEPSICQPYTTQSFKMVKSNPKTKTERIQLTFTCSKLTIETLEKNLKYVQRYFEYISHHFVVFLLLILNKQMLAGKWILNEEGSTDNDFLQLNLGWKYWRMKCLCRKWDKVFKNGPIKFF